MTGLDNRVTSIETQNPQVVVGLSFLAILMLATCLRFWSLGTESIWLDEAVSWEQSRGGLWRLVRETARDNYPPLHNLILLVFIHAFGDSETILRWPSAVFGVANVAALYWLGASLKERAAGLLAAYFLTVSKFHIWHSQDARMYALLALCATLFALTSVRYVERPTGWRALWAMLAAIALLYSHAYGALNWIAISFPILLTILLAPSMRKATLIRWIVMQVLVGCAFLPWAIVLHERAHVIIDSGFWISEPSIVFVVNQVSKLVSGRPMILILTVGVVMALRSQEPTRIPGSSDNASRKYGHSFRITPETGLLLSWLIVPPLVGLAASLALEPVFLSRYIIGSLPAFLLLASIGFVRFAGQVAPRFASRWIKGGIAAVLLVGVAVIGYRGPEKRTDFRSAVAVLVQERRADECVIIYKRLVEAAVRYYHREPIFCLEAPKSVGSLNREKLISDRIWIILNRANADERAELLGNLPTGPWEVERRQFYNVDVLILSRKQA